MQDGVLTQGTIPLSSSHKRNMPIEEPVEVILEEPDREEPKEQALYKTKEKS